MFLGDKGKENEYHHVRRNFDIVIDNESFTLQKLSHELGFYSIMPLGKDKETEIVFDTEGNLLSGSGLILRKKISADRTYFSFVRISSIKGTADREKKYFLGECEANDVPSDFPVQIADGINHIFNNLFTVNVVDIVKHCTPYIKIEILANKYKIVSGTGYEAELSFETLKIRDLRTGRKAKVRNFSLNMAEKPGYEREREHILDIIDRKCKELVPTNRNRFEIAEVAVRIPVQKSEDDNKDEKTKKKSRKELKAEMKKKQQEQE